MAYIPSILEQHADEAITLIPLREKAINGVTSTLSGLIKLDYRLDANFDGLRIADDAGWEICERLVQEERTAGAFTAAVVAFSSGNEARVQKIVDAASKNPGIACELASALGWLSFTKVEQYIYRFLSCDQPVIRNAGVAALARHGIDPASMLQSAIEGSDHSQRCQLLRAAGELGRADLLALLQDELSTEDTDCRFWAAWSSTLLGGCPDASAVLESFVEAPGHYQEEAVSMLSRRHSREQSAHFIDFSSHSLRNSRLTTIAAGANGHSFCVPILIEQMKIPELARLAGEAFTMITGVGVASISLDASRPQGFEAGPTDDPEDDDVEPDLDDGLPWPDPAAAAQWWEEHQGDFEPESRYLLGRPISANWMYDILLSGRQGQRIAANLELAMLQRGMLMFDLQAPAFRQQQRLRSTISNHA